MLSKHCLLRYFHYTKGFTRNTSYKLYIIYAEDMSQSKYSIDHSKNKLKELFVQDAPGSLSN